MTKLLSLFSQAFSSQSKNNDLEQFIKNPNYIIGIKKSLNNLVEAWIEARTAQAKYYNTHSHIG